MIDQMLLSILMIIASLIAGVAAGLIKKGFSDNEKSIISHVMTGLVLILILLMGIKTGINDDVISNLDVYGINALLIAMASIIGSLAFALLFEKLVLRGVTK